MPGVRKSSTLPFQGPRLEAGTEGDSVGCQHSWQFAAPYMREGARESWPE